MAFDSSRVPYDIWIYIAQFLPHHVLPRLCGINRAFFDIVVENHYREMHVYDLDAPQTKQKLGELSNLVAAERVRKLHLRPYMLGAPISIPEKTAWGGLKRRVAGWKTNAGAKREARQMLDNLKNLRNLETLEIQCLVKDDLASFRRALPLLRQGWSTYGPSLRTLSLRIPLEMYHDLMPSSGLPRLTDLTIYIFTSNYSTNPVEPMCSFVVPFINHHTFSLESLSIITPETGTADLSPMFFNLKFFRRLSRISLMFCALSLEYINLEGVQEFFSAHATQIQELVLHFNRMLGLKTENFRTEIFFASPLFKVPLPALKSLDLGFTGFRDPTGLATIAYPQKFKSTLQNLSLNYAKLSIANVHQLICRLPSLQTLELFVDYLSPALLDILSNNLLHLKDLRLTFLCFSGSGGSYDVSDADSVRVHRFCAEMTRRLYIGWELRHLRIQILGNSAGILHLCQKALVAALPGVETFNGFTPTEYLSEESPGKRAEAESS